MSVTDAHEIFRLPTLREDARGQLTKAKNEIDSLPPPPPKHPAAELLRLVSEFSQDVKNFVMGFEGHEALIRQCLPAYSQFRRDILSTRPQFSASERVTGDKPSRDDILPQMEDESEVKALRDPIYVDEVKEMIRKWVE